jgi:hypothetical protein
MCNFARNKGHLRCLWSLHRSAVEMQLGDVVCLHALMLVMDVVGALLG